MPFSYAYDVEDRADFEQSERLNEKGRLKPGGLECVNELKTTESGAG